jgi:hypothetical protein
MDVISEQRDEAKRKLRHEGENINTQRFIIKPVSASRKTQLIA